MMQSSCYKEPFDTAIKALLSSNCLKGNSQESYVLLANFIKRTLRQFNLDNFDMEDVISEAYIRGIKRINSGENIENPGAWLRITSFNIIREMSRNQKKQQLVDPNSLDYQVVLEVHNDFSLEESDNDNFKLLKISLQKMEPQDRQILILREMKGLSWKEVVKHLASDGVVVREASARQRGRRAMERLRQIYLSH